MQRHEYKERPTEGAVVIQSAEQYGSTELAAKILGLSASFLNKARVAGDGPPYAKFGHAVRYHIPTILEWAAARIRRSTSESEVV